MSVGFDIIIVLILILCNVWKNFLVFFVLLVCVIIFVVMYIFVFCLCVKVIFFFIFLKLKLFVCDWRLKVWLLIYIVFVL